jgi:hypothetical protein
VVSFGIVFIRIKVARILRLIFSFSLLLVEIFLVDVWQIGENFWHLMNSFLFVFLLVYLETLFQITEYIVWRVRCSYFFSARFLWLSIPFNDSMELKIFFILKQRWDHVRCLVPVRVNVLNKFTVSFQAFFLWVEPVKAN